jgi:hypothetical protein
MRSWIEWYNVGRPHSAPGISITTRVRRGGRLRRCRPGPDPSPRLSLSRADPK